MRRAPTRAIALAIVIVTTLESCSWHAASPVGSALVGDEVGQAELTASGATSLFDALARTRALYFHQRGASSLVDAPADAVLVFRDGALVGTVETLRLLRPVDVRLVRRLSPTETYRKYGRRVSVAGLEVELTT